MRGLLVSLCIASLALAGCSGGSDGSSSSSTTGMSSTSMMDHTAKTYNVAISGSAFSNATLNIRTGDTVIWTNNDPAPTAHTVTSDSGDAFDSHPNCNVGVPVSQVCMTQGDTYTHKFEREGTFAIHCKVHSSMTMSITVASHNMTMDASAHHQAHVA